MPSFVRFLRCPHTGSPLKVESLGEKDGRIQEGWPTATTNPELHYPIKQFSWWQTSAWYKLEVAKLKEWAVLDTFDMLSRTV